MKLSGEYTFSAPVAEVWSALLDPAVLAAAMPGCEKLELVGGQYVGELNIKVGPVQGRFTGKVELADIVELHGYTVKVDGRGVPGFVQATAKVKLEALGGETKMSYEADAKVGGKIASVGERLLDASAKAIIKQSLEGLHENVKRRAAFTASTASAPASSAASAASPSSAPASSVSPSAAPASSASPSAAPPSSASPSAAPASSASPSAAPASSASTTSAAGSPSSAPPLASETKESLAVLPASTTPAPRSEPEAAHEAARAIPAPVRIDQTQLAAAVAKEVTKAILPRAIALALIAVALAAALWFLFGRGTP